MEHVMIKKSNIINICKNYDVIVNYVYNEEDMMTKILINYYRDCISYINMHNMEEVNSIYKYDKALACYLNQYEFKRMVKLEYDSNTNCNNAIMDNLISLYNKYNTVINMPNIKEKWL